MATSGAYKNSAYTFNFSFTKASDPTAFFTGTFLTSEVKVVTRDGGTTNAAVNIASAPSHEGNGVYEINLTASGMNHDEIMIVLVPSSADVVPESISIVTEPTPSDILEVQQTAVSGVADFRATGFSTFDPAADTVANVTTVGSVTAPVTTDSASRTASQADVSALATSAALATAQADLDTLTGTDGVTLATSQPNYAPNTTTPPTAAAVADAVWDEARSAHTTAGSFGEGVKVESLNTQAKSDVNAEADTAISDASLATATALATAQTDLDTLTGVDGVTLATSQPNYAPNTTTPPTAAAIRAEVDSNSTQLAAIVADTNELQADLANGGRLDLILDSILAALDDPRGEPGAGAPPVNPDAMTKLDYLYKAWRNKKEQTSSAFSLYDDAGTTVDHQATVSDDGTTATFGEIGAGS
jgi:hypothetical protein